jgi:hypothetical protein
MTTTVLAPYLTSQFFGNNGAFLSGGQIFTYQAGTVTPIATYTDSTGGTPNTNPIVLNARGECSIWVNPNTAYKFVLQDSSGNTIWTRDQVIQSQLITLYGGVDTGGVNAYILNFAAPYTSYVDGTVIYWIPANTNTGPSTINVNGLGVVNLVNQGGSALTAGQIFANQIAVIMYKGGSFYLVSSGYSSAAAQTLFIANRSVGAGAQALAGNSTTTVIFDNTSINRGTNYNTATGLFTAAIAGIYTFTATLVVTSSGAASGYGPYYFSKNLASTTGNYWPLNGLIQGSLSGSTPASVQQGIFGATANFSMNSGDTMSIRCQMPNPGGGFTVAGDGKSSQFSGYQSG